MPSVLYLPTYHSQLQGKRSKFKIKANVVSDYEEPPLMDYRIGREQIAFRNAIAVNAHWHFDKI